MFALERIRIIKHYLKENQQVEVHALSTMLDVSEVTIRRDLEKLENEGFLKRTHGGAILTEEHPLFSPANEDEPEEIQEIAIVAMNLISNGDVLMMMNGSINLNLARKLSSRSGLTVLTNDMKIAAEISGQSANKVVLLGGDVSNDQSALFGSLSIGNLKKFRFNKIFVEVDGISDDLQLTVSSQEKADLVQAAMDGASEKILMCRSSLLQQHAFFFLGHISIADKIITNPTLPDSLKSAIFASNIPLYTSINAFEGHI